MNEWICTFRLNEMNKATDYKYSSTKERMGISKTVEDDSPEEQFPLPYVQTILLNINNCLFFSLILP